MSTTDDQVLVLLLACLTEDRDPAEQRAMLAQALALDAERGAFTAGNFRNGRAPVPPRLVGLARETYSPAEGRRVDLTQAQRGRYQRLAEKWEWCSACDAPRGMHPVGGCLTDPVPVEREYLQRLGAAMEGAHLEVEYADLVARKQEGEKQ